jgi:hypothetical protein
MGHTWLPMGNRSGFATRFVTLQASDPATPQPIADFAMNSRRVITFTRVSFCISQPGRYRRVRHRFACEAFIILTPAESQNSLRPPSRSEAEAKSTASPVRAASRKLPSKTILDNKVRSGV